jgi:hypothetical protein
MSGGYLDENVWTHLPVDFQEPRRKAFAEDRASKSVALALAHQTRRRRKLDAYRWLFFDRRPFSNRRGWICGFDKPWLGPTSRSASPSRFDVCRHHNMHLLLVPL